MVDEAGLSTVASTATAAGLLRDSRDAGVARDYARRVGTLIRNARKNRG